MITNTENLIKISDFSRQYKRAKGGIGVNRQYIYYLIRIKKLKAIKIAGQWFIEKPKTDIVSEKRK